jgi:hypothetical protein
MVLVSGDPLMSNDVLIECTRIFNLYNFLTINTNDIGKSVVWKSAVDSLESARRLPKPAPWSTLT